MLEIGGRYLPKIRCSSAAVRTSSVVERLRFVAQASAPPILILAGGKGTRLKNLAANTPKYLMPISENETFADIHLQWLRSLGFKRVFLSIGHLGEQIRSYCGDGSKWSLEISYLEDGNEPLGTGGAVRKALQFEFSELCVTYGDTLLNFSFSEFLHQYRQSHALGSMTIYENQVPGHICNATMDGAYVIYDKVHPESDWKYIDYGFLLLSRPLLESFPLRIPLDLSEPLSSASRQKKILGFPVTERFWEIGSPEALSEFQKKFRS